MEAFKMKVEELSPFTVSVITRNYIEQNAQRLIDCLDKDEARACRMDHQSFVEFMNSIQDGWDDHTMIGTVVTLKCSDDPVAFAVAVEKPYEVPRSDISGIRELDRDRTALYQQSNQWCVEYVVRKTNNRGSGAASIALGALMVHLAAFDDEGMLWLLVAGGFRNRSAVSLYTDVGFIVTRLGFKTMPIMSVQVREIGQRPHRKMEATLTLRYLVPTLIAERETGGVGGAAGGGEDAAGGGTGNAGAVGQDAVVRHAVNVGAGAGGVGQAEALDANAAVAVGQAAAVDANAGENAGGDAGAVGHAAAVGANAGENAGGDAGGDGQAAAVDANGNVGAVGQAAAVGGRARRHRRRRRRQRRLDLLQVRAPPARAQRRRQQLVDLIFMEKEVHLRFTANQLFVPPTCRGSIAEMVQRLSRMVDAALVNNASVTYLVHLDIAKQCHNIAYASHLHVSRWLVQQRQENRDDDAWQRKFRSLADDVRLLWSVFRLPCLTTLEISYSAASRRGGLRDIVQACEKLVEDDKPLPESIRHAQQQMYKRVITSFLYCCFFPII